eukprot:SAG31_NODE_4083_length_3604_cov_3.076462_4_plen_126_part_00
MWTAALVHSLLHSLTLTVSLRHVCVFISPVFAAGTCVVTYLLGAELNGSRTGLVAAAFISIIPAYTSRSVAGSFDVEAVAVFALVLVCFLFVRAVNTGSIFCSALAATAYFYLVAAWGGVSLAFG